MSLVWLVGRRVTVAMNGHEYISDPFVAFENEAEADAVCDLVERISRERPMKTTAGFMSVSASTKKTELPPMTLTPQPDRRDERLADDDIAADYRNEQSYFNSLSALPRATETAVPRYFKGWDCPDSTTADVVYIDRLTGKEVMRYDGADPANTRFDYGATPDAEIFARRGLNIKEMIDPAKAVISIQECRNRMRVDLNDDGDW